MKNRILTALVQSRAFYREHGHTLPVAIGNDGNLILVADDTGAAHCRLTDSGAVWSYVGCASMTLVSVVEMAQRMLGNGFCKCL